MPFLFCLVYARLPFFRNFYGEKKRCTPPIVAEKKWRSTFSVGML